jgi:oligopeptide/dipeptide ABC transporter ATP-binding protein
MTMRQPGDQAVLEVRDLHVRIPTSRGVVTAVDGVSFDVHRGELLAVLGESGCGKSATARAILGLAFGRGAEVSGQILIEGSDLGALSEKARRSVRGDAISMIFQDALASLNPVQSVGGQIAEAVRVGGAGRAAARRRALELMADVGIPDPRERAKAYPHQFSGGMRQRAMIAMALARDPKVLIADEPTTALDVTVQAQILDLLERHRRERDMALLLISHDLGVVARNADRILVLYAGRVAECGPADEVLTAPRHPYTRGLLDSAASRRRRLERLRPIPGSPPDLAVPILGCGFAPRCPLVRATCATQPPLIEVGPGRASACWASEEVTRAL